MIKLSGYKIIKKIGSGGMGDVYLAEHEKLEKKVAIKSLHKNLATDTSFRERFFQEAKTHSKLDHPNIVKLLDYKERKDGLFLVMEYVDGKQLDEHIKKVTGPIPEKELTTLFTQILDAIGYAHEEGLVHRDIKPSNIMIDKRGRIKVLDFGIAKMQEEEKGLTKTGIQIGTATYMSPEQVNAKKVDKLSDIYSLGVTLYYMAVGKSPYDGETNTFSIQTKIVSESFPEASEAYPGVSNKIETIIKKATQKNKKDRYQNCEEFKKDLDSKNIIVSEKIKASTKTQVVKKKKKFKLSNIIAVAVILLLVAGYFFYFNNNVKPQPLPETYLVDGQEITLEDVYSDQVVMTGYIWNNKSTMQPVTGRYIDSEGRFGGLIINGLNDGLWREWYKNGQLSGEINYKNGKPDGLTKRWHENGQLAFEGTYKDGKSDGLHRKWHENGQLAFEGTYKDGSQVGFTHKEWDKKGQFVLNKYYQTASEKLAEEKLRIAEQKRMELDVFQRLNHSLRSKKSTSLHLIFNNIDKPSTTTPDGPNDSEALPNGTFLMKFTLTSSHKVKIKTYYDPEYYTTRNGWQSCTRSYRFSKWNYDKTNNKLILRLEDDIYRRIIEIDEQGVSYLHQNYTSKDRLQLEPVFMRATGFIKNVF